MKFAHLNFQKFISQANGQIVLPNVKFFLRNDHKILLKGCLILLTRLIITIICNWGTVLSQIVQNHSSCICTFAGGRHAMALTVDGKVFSWGEGDDGKLGHYSRTYVTLDCVIILLCFQIHIPFGYLTCCCHWLVCIPT